MPESFPEGILEELETRAMLMAGEAGEILRQHWGKPLKTDYKGKGKRDPVTAADIESQKFLKETISRYFPEHGIIAEEDTEKQDSPSPDFLWVVDPLDGTTNFLNGLPMYAVSLGVLYKGIPVAGALFIPWPEDEGGLVFHARKGGGAFANKKPISVLHLSEPQGDKLTNHPAYLSAAYRFGKGMRHRVGEVRTTGSIAYELALAAYGVSQYVIHTQCRIWDVAAGVLLIKEAGGKVLTRPRRAKKWHPLDTFFPSWDSYRPTQQQVREWGASLISGSPDIAQFVSEQLRGRLLLRYRLAKMWRRLLKG
ncbi:MAG: hypothetical protein HY666_03255 [Chloroflexi bacterium]|nr:hypothetical protein [Chloroflexota bacterium]